MLQVSLDYYIQGFCRSALTLRPSAFYNAAGRRTAAIMPSIYKNATCAGHCGSESDSLHSQIDLCHLRGCNNKQ